MLFALLSSNVFADEILGRVIRVADGDTITVRSVGASVGRDIPIESYPSQRGFYTPVNEAPTPQSRTLLHPSLERSYTPVQEALTPQSKRLLHPSLARLYTPV